MSQENNIILNILNECPLIEVLHNDKLKNCCVIVEPVYDLLMRQVINNFAYVLNDEWNFKIYTSHEYEDQIYNELPNVEFCCIEYVSGIKPELMTISDYNKLLMSHHFWGSIDYENILIFQKDCFCFNKPDLSLFEYSYVGAETGGIHITPYYNLNNGGCSFRKKSCMLKCLEKIDQKHINIYRNNYKLKDLDNSNEDIYFSHACEILHEPLMTQMTQHKFFIECIPENKILRGEKTCFIHGWNKKDNSCFGDRPNQEQILRLLKNSKWFFLFL